MRGPRGRRRGESGLTAVAWGFGAPMMAVDGALTSSSLGVPSSVPWSALPKREPSADCHVDDSLPTGRPTQVLQIDKDWACPICMQIMRDAFLTSCGHSFCYSCITTHLANKRNCPCCAHFLTQDQLFPNFLLNKLLKKAAASQLASNASPTDQLRLALQQGAEVSVKELDALLALLAEKKRKAEQEEAEANLDILLDFLHRSRQQKQEELHELRSDLQFLKEDIAVVEQRRQEVLHQAKEASAKLQLLLNGAPPTAGGALVSAQGQQAAPRHRGQGRGQGRAVALLGSGAPGRLSGARSSRDTRSGSQGHDRWGNAHTSGAPRALEGASPEAPASPAAAASAAKKRRVFAQFEDLQECYLQRRRRLAALSESDVREMARTHDGKKGAAGPGFQGLLPSSGRTGLDDFETILSAFTKYSRLRVIAELRHGDLFHTSNIVSSIEFDRDDELFATAGVSRRIKVFELSTVVNELADVHCPVVEMSTRSKLSCLSWNKYIKSHIASANYEGIVTVWDVNTCQALMEYEEHEKRAWSVDFSRTEPTRLVSGSDDGKVKVWCTRQEQSVLNIDMKANICCVKWNPAVSHHVAVGSADHHIHYYDVRRTQVPLHMFSGHQKAVSYVKFVSPTELASASTDSTLRLWDVQHNIPLRTFRGHVNEKNFVGLSMNSDYIACGSESNEVYVYYKAMSKPAAVHRFGSSDPMTGEDSDDDAAHFISAVCWKSDSPTMLAANSQGTIRVLVLAP